nr:unnamed protein product [Callosobruchus analis]
MSCLYTDSVVHIQFTYECLYKII